MNECVGDLALIDAERLGTRFLDYSRNFLQRSRVMGSQNYG